MVPHPGIDVLQQGLAVEIYLTSPKKPASQIDNQILMFMQWL